MQLVLPITCLYSRIPLFVFLSPHLRCMFLSSRSCLWQCTRHISSRLVWEWTNESISIHGLFSSLLVLRWLMCSLISNSSSFLLWVHNVHNTKTHGSTFLLGNSKYIYTCKWARMEVRTMRKVRDYTYLFMGAANKSSTAM